MGTTGGNLLFYHLSQIMALKVKMIHLTICNKIISDLDCSLIVTINNNQGCDREPKLTQEFLDTNNLCASINNTIILNFNS